MPAIDVPLGPRTPNHLRWVRSGNDMLHAAGTKPPESGRTVCGRSLRDMAWSNFCGPRVLRRTLAIAEPPICTLCDNAVPWIDADTGAPVDKNGDPRDE